MTLKLTVSCTTTDEEGSHAITLEIAADEALAGQSADSHDQLFRLFELMQESLSGFHEHSAEGHEQEVRDSPSVLPLVPIFDVVS